MDTATFDGDLYHAGIAGDPVVFLSVFDEGPFEDWHRANRLFTQIWRQPHPKSKIDRVIIYVTEDDVAGISDGTTVRITVEVRPEKRGNGIGIIEVVRAHT